jgi:uncharacterized membrane protein
MEALPLHPKLVHLPMALAVLMPVLASVLLLAWWRGWLPRRAWILACLAQALLLASGVVAMRTGEADEERIENFVPDRAIELHEEAAEAFVWGSGLVLVLALLPLLVRNPRRARWVGLGAFAGTVVVLLLGFRVGEAGGALVYRHDAAAAYVTGEPTASRAPAVHGTDDEDLEGGEKWHANEATHAGMGRIRAQLAEFAVSDARAYTALGETLRAEASAILENCTMTGEAHVRLHRVLSPMLEAIDALVKGSGGEAAVEALRAGVEEYHAHFER